MRQELKSKLELLKFVPNELGGMTTKMDDVRFTAIEHPIKGLAIIVEHIGARTATQFETFVPFEASLQDIAKAMTQAYEQIHPEKK